MKGWLYFRVIAVGFLFLFVSAAGFAESVVLTLIPPDGDVSGPPGSTAGWGYTITNNTFLWLESVSLSAGSFSDGTPKAIFDFPNVAPNSSVTEAFSPAMTPSCSSPPCGLYEFTWDNSAPVGALNAGTFSVGFDYFSGDPANPSSVDLGPAPDADASYSASVLPAVVPEPGTFVLLLAGLFSVAVLFRNHAELDGASDYSHGS